MPVWVIFVSVNLAIAKVVPEQDSVQKFTPSNKQQLAHKVEGKHLSSRNSAIFCWHALDPGIYMDVI